MKELVVGIDIGGTNTKIGIVDREGNLLHHTSIETTAYIEVEDYFNGMADTVKMLCKNLTADQKLVGIGVGHRSAGWR